MVCIDIFLWLKEDLLMFFHVYFVEELIRSRAAWTEALLQSVTTHERATKQYSFFEFLYKKTTFESWDFWPDLLNMVN